MTTMLLLVLVSALVACQFHAANASFVRGGVVEQIPSDGASRTELEQQARIEELQAQLAELQRSLAQCSTQQLTNSSEVVSPRVVKVEPVRPEPLAVDAIRVVREYASPNWHNSSTARRLGDLTADGDDSTKPVIGICLASTSKSKKTKISGACLLELPFHRRASGQLTTLIIPRYVCLRLLYNRHFCHSAVPSAVAVSCM